MGKEFDHPGRERTLHVGEGLKNLGVSLMESSIVFYPLFLERTFSLRPGARSLCLLTPYQSYPSNSFLVGQFDLRVYSLLIIKSD